MEVFLILIIIFGVAFIIYKSYQKIKNKRWFQRLLFNIKRFFYYLKTLLLSLVIIFFVYLFFKELYAYLFYPLYPATIERYEEYNSTDKDGVLTQNHSVVYRFEVDGKKIFIEEGGFEEGKLRAVGTKVEIFYKNKEVVEYNLENLFFSFLKTLFGSLFMLFHILKGEFPSKLVLPSLEEDEVIEEETE